VQELLREPACGKGRDPVNELDDVQTTIGVIDGLRSRIAALEAELAKRDRMLDLLAGALATAVWDGLEYRRHVPLRIRTITAAGPLLRSYYANPASVIPNMTKAAILADLRARAEREATP